MSPDQLSVFRLRCRQFQVLAWFMLGSVGLVLAINVAAVMMADMPEAGSWGRPLLQSIPGLCYLYAVWVIGQAMGALSNGALFQPVLARALRRAGLALGTGGVFSVFLMTNLMRLFGLISGGWLYFDIAGMTLGMLGGALFLLGALVDRADRLQSELDEMV
ncbi:MAG: DUF2975 domain-containing protein [Caulobacterales bacterium]|nr:DUF2975 domain-containing protein [Caulobacterales bacterium]